MVFLAIVTITEDWDGSSTRWVEHYLPFRNVLAMDKADWKPFRNALDKSERKDFDDMFDIPRLYLSACSNSTQLVPLHPIIMSILFHHYKELAEITSEVEKIEKA